VETGGAQSTPSVDRHSVSGDHGHLAPALPSPRPRVASELAGR
jgi:hypothetical protein